MTSSTPESSTGPDARVGPDATNEATPGGKTTTTPEVSAPPAPEPRRPRIRSTLLRHSLLMLLAFVGIALLLETLDPFRASQLAAMAYYVPTVAGLTVLTGLNGQISLGHGALMAVGAYTTALMLEAESPLPYLLILLASVFTTSLVGVVVGAAASRLHGPYLAGATLALAVGLPGLALYFAETLGGEEGIRVSPPDAPVWVEDVAFFITGNDLTGTKYLGYLGWALALIVLVLLSNLVRSRYGRLWRAVRDDEVAAELSGINLGRTRVLAFVVSAVAAGVGGSLLAIVTRLAGPTSFTIVLSIFLLVAIVIGGLGSLLGAVLGSALLVFLVPFVTNVGLDSGLTSAQAANIAPLAFGIVLIVVMLAAPQGVVGTIRMKYLTRQASQRRRAEQG